MSSTTAVYRDSQHLDLTRSEAAAGSGVGDRSSSYRTGSYDHSTESWFPGGLPTPPRTKDMMRVSLNGSHGTYSQSQQYQPSYDHSQMTQPYKLHSRVPSDYRPDGQQASVRNSTPFDLSALDKTKTNTIASHLQIPESVNKSRGSLAEFAAEITCLFWFESAAVLEYAEKLSVEALPNRGLVTDAIPSFGFKKWVTTILSTTQVGKNVVLLALMFIYRLKKFNPSVSGKRGSEFRLLTIALMLGNKFLDDNTYTNKTWAEVSGISVTEIHIMEVEFLSNMRYELYASEEDWDHWKSLLGQFGHFYEKASKFFSQQIDDVKSHLPITPTSQTFGYKLPSPPSNQLNPTYLTSYSNLPNPMTTLPQLPRSPVRQHVSNNMPAERKRSLDTSESLPPAKRIHYSAATVNVSSGILTPSPGVSSDLVITNQVAPLGTSRIPQLPVPRLPPTSSRLGTHLAPLALPPTRPMTSTYQPPPSTTAWSQPATPLSAVPPPMSGPYQNCVTPIADGVRSNIGSANTSPVNMYSAVTPTRQGLSPSYFLTNRSSPYRPVRHVNTLLIPPPSAAMHNTAKNIAFEQMHYEPLGRPSERRPGPVPYYQPEGWSHSNVSTPTGIFYRPI